MRALTQSARDMQIECARDESAPGFLSFLFLLPRARAARAHARRVRARQAARGVRADARYYAAVLRYVMPRCHTLPCYF